MQIQTNDITGEIVQIGFGVVPRKWNDWTIRDVESLPTAEEGKRVIWDNENDGTLDNSLDGNWHHLTFIFDVPNETITAYLDGASANVISSTEGSGTLGDTTTSRHFSIGAAWNDATTQDQHYLGQLDDLRIYNAALTASDIRLVMRGEQPARIYA